MSRRQSNAQRPLRWAMLLGGSVFILGAVLVASLVPQPASETPPREIALQDGELLLYLESLSRIQKEALFLNGTIPRRRIVQDTLKAYLQSQDPYSDYLTAEEYVSFKSAQDERYVGIGLEIAQHRNGEFSAFPYPGGAAERAGVVPGDRITHINAVPVAGKTLFSLAALARGQPGTSVRLTLQSKSGLVRAISVMRANTVARNVSRQAFGRTPVIKIVSFTHNTKSDLVSILKEWDRSDPIVIDLRGNAGGDLHAAIDSAMLFLDRDRRIVTLETRTGTRTYTSGNAAVDTGSPLYLWQDEATASAAEVFIAALTQNGRGVSIGRRTFGKGTQQEFIELSDGSALVLTTGYLLTPEGGDFRDRGLEPTHRLTEEEPDTDRYLARLGQLRGTVRPFPKPPPNATRGDE